MIARFGNERAEYRLRPKIKLAQIKHDFTDRIGFEGMNFFPDTIELYDSPKVAKGNTVPVKDYHWKFIEKINDANGYKYARSIGDMWINKAYDIDTPYSEARAEPIQCGGNFVAWDLEQGNFVRLIAFPNSFDLSKLDPSVYNWRNMPHLFWKACSVERNGTKVQKVKDGFDVYIPFLNSVPVAGQPAEWWIDKWRLDFLGEEQFTFYDGDVYLNGKLFRATGVVK